MNRKCQDESSKQYCMDSRCGSMVCPVGIEEEIQICKMFINLATTPQ